MAPAIKRIVNENAKRLSVTKRQSTLKKKARELSILCGIDVGLVCIAGPDFPDQTAEIWPESKSEVSDLLSKYKSFKGKKLCECGPLPGSSNKLERTSNEGSELGSYSLEELVSLSSSLDSKLLKIAESKVARTSEVLINQNHKVARTSEVLINQNHQDVNSNKPDWMSYLDLENFQDSDFEEDLGGLSEGDLVEDNNNLGMVDSQVSTSFNNGAQFGTVGGTAVPLQSGFNYGAQLGSAVCTPVLQSGFNNGAQFDAVDAPVLLQSGFNNGAQLVAVETPVLFQSGFDNEAQLVAVETPVPLQSGSMEQQQQQYNHYSYFHQSGCNPQIVMDPSSSMTQSFNFHYQQPQSFNFRYQQPQSFNFQYQQPQSFNFQCQQP